MEFREALRRRRMVRRHTGDPIDPASLDRIVAAAHRGPSAGFAQGIVTIAISEPDDIAAIAVLCDEPAHVARGLPPWIGSSGALVALCVDPRRYRDRYAEPDKDPEVVTRIPWWWVDGGAALGYLLLAAVDEGLGAGFLGGHRLDAVAVHLGIPDGIELVGLVTLGPPVADRPSSSTLRGRRPEAEVARRHSWEQAGPHSGGDRGR